MSGKGGIKMKLTQKQLDYLQTFMNKHKSYSRPVLNQFYYSEELDKIIFTDSITLVEIKADNVKESIPLNDYVTPYKIEELSYPDTERLWNKTAEIKWIKEVSVKELKKEVIELKNKDKDYSRGVKDAGTYKLVSPPQRVLLNDKYHPTVDLNRLHKLLILCERFGVKRLNFSIINSVRPIEIYTDIEDIRFILAPIRTL